MPLQKPGDYPPTMGTAQEKELGTKTFLQNQAFGNITTAGNNQSKFAHKIKNSYPPISLHPHICIIRLKMHTVIPTREKNSNSQLAKK